MHNDLQMIIKNKASKLLLFYGSLFHALEPGDPLELPRSIIWRSGAPPKVAFFALEDTWGENPSFGSGPKEGVFIGE